MDLFYDGEDRKQNNEAPPPLWLPEPPSTNTGNLESRLFTPHPSKSAELPELELCEGKTLNGSDVSSMISNVARNLANDIKFGAPQTQAGDISRSAGLIEHIYYPNKHELLQFSYSDRSTGQISDISMGAKNISFLYSGDKLTSIQFSGSGRPHSTIDFNIFDGTATQDGRAVSIDGNQLGYDIFNFLRDK